MGPPGLGPPASGSTNFRSGEPTQQNQVSNAITKIPIQIYEILRFQWEKILMGKSEKVRLESLRKLNIELIITYISQHVKSPEIGGLTSKRT